MRADLISDGNGYGEYYLKFSKVAK